MHGLLNSFHSDHREHLQTKYICISVLPEMGVWRPKKPSGRAPGLLGLLRAELSFPAPWLLIMIPLTHFYTFAAIAGKAGAERSLCSLARGLGDLCRAQGLLNLTQTALRNWHQIRWFLFTATFQWSKLSPLVMNEWMSLFGLCLPVLKNKLINKPPSEQHSAPSFLEELLSIRAEHLPKRVSVQERLFIFN